MHLPLGAPPHTPRNAQKHQESHLCLAANFSRMYVVGHSPDGGEGAQLRKSWVGTASRREQQMHNKHSVRRGQGENCPECDMACVVVSFQSENACS